MPASGVDFKYLGEIKSDEFVDQVNNYQLLNGVKANYRWEAKLPCLHVGHTVWRLVFH
jgi:hypothetical protein